MKVIEEKISIAALPVEIENGMNKARNDRGDRGNRGDRGDRKSMTFHRPMTIRVWTILQRPEISPATFISAI